MQSAKNTTEPAMMSAANAMASTKASMEQAKAIAQEKAERITSESKRQRQLKNTSGMGDYLATAGTDTGDYMTTGSDRAIGTGSSTRTGTGVGPGAATITGDSRRSTAPVRADAPRVAADSRRS